VPIDIVNGYGAAVRTLTHKRVARLNDLTALQLAIRTHQEPAIDLVRLDQAKVFERDQGITLHGGAS
jgi:hypothetical protein